MRALRRRITVTSSLNKISTNQLGNRAVTVTSGQIIKNDGFFSSSDICFMSATISPFSRTAKNPYSLSF